MERCRFSGHQGDVASCTFSPDGKILASGSFDSTALLWDLTGRLQGGRLRPAALQPDELQNLWTDLCGDDAAKAYRALWTLAAAPGQTVPFLQKHLEPAAPVDGKRIARLIGELDDDVFAMREKASAELEKLGQQAESALRKALEKPTSAEMQRRVERLLEKLEKPAASSERLRLARSLEVLEQMGTPAARSLLQALAKGAPEAWLTQEVKTILERLAKRPVDTP
jgi:hypothetical protein